MIRPKNDLLLTGGGGGDEGEGSPEYQPPEMPEMDVKPAMGRVGSAKGVEPEYPREFPSNGESYLPTTTSQQWHYTHQQMLSVPTPTNPYLGHDVPRGYGRDVTSEEFREGGEEGGEGMDGMKGPREEIGHYDADMISQTGPIRGYTRADAFVWRPY